MSVGGLVVKSIVAIDGPRVRFPADANFFFSLQFIFFFPFLISREKERNVLSGVLLRAQGSYTCLRLYALKSTS
jgi:hypothetical protein